MNIVLIGPFFPYRGGISDTNQELCESLIKTGHKVDVITFKLQYPSFLFPGKTQFHKNDLKQKIAEGIVESPTQIIKGALAQYKSLKAEYKNPNIHLKVIEMIRAEYIVNRKFKVFAEVAQQYYKFHFS